MTRNFARSTLILALVSWAWTAAAVPMGSPLTPRAPAVGESPVAQAVDAGYQALNRGDPKAARAAFEEAAKRYPGSALPYLGLAELARLERQPAAAEAMIRKAVSVEPKSAEAHRALGRLQFTQSKFADAEASFKKAVSLDPKDPSAYIDLAENYLNGIKKPAAAADAYRKAIQLEPKHPGAHMGLAAALALQGDVAGAAGEYRAAAKLDPNSPLALHRLGLLYAQRGELAQALGALDEALAVAQRQKAAYVPGLIDRGDIHLANGSVEKAAADYQAAVKANPKNAVALLKAGTALQLQQKWPEAERYYLQAIEIDPNTYAAYNNLAWMAATQKKNLDQALRWSKRAIEIEPQQAALYDTLATVHRARGEKDLAIAAWKKAASIKPPKATYLYRLGLALDEAGKAQEAIAALRSALKTSSDFPEAAEARARLKTLEAATK